MKFKAPNGLRTSLGDEPSAAYMLWLKARGDVVDARPVFAAPTGEIKLVRGSAPQGDTVYARNLPGARTLKVLRRK
jgi:hypothetical protein